VRHVLRGEVLHGLRDQVRHGPREEVPGPPRGGLRGTRVGLEFLLNFFALTKIKIPFFQHKKIEKEKGLSQNLLTSIK